MKAREFGFLGTIFPEELRGPGMGYVEYVLVVTELSKIDPSVGISVAAHNSLRTNHNYKFGNDEQSRRRWVTPLAPSGSDRPERWLRCRCRSNQGRKSRRRLDLERHQAIHHPRLGGGFA